MTPTLSPRHALKKQVASLLKARCRRRRYTIRVTQMWLNIGYPLARAVRHFTPPIRSEEP